MYQFLKYLLVAPVLVLALRQRQPPPHFPTKQIVRSLPCKDRFRYVLFLLTFQNCCLDLFFGYLLCCPHSFDARGERELTASQPWTTARYTSTADSACHPEQSHLWNLLPGPSPLVRLRHTISEEVPSRCLAASPNFKVEAVTDVAGIEVVLV